MQLYCIVYGRFIEDKVDGIYLESLYYGGIADDITEAQNIAQECVNSQSGTIFHRIIQFKLGEFIDAINLGKRKLEKLEKDMIETEDFMKHNETMAKKRRK